MIAGCEIRTRRREMAKSHVFPWWGGYLLLSPLRKRSVDPMDLLRPYVWEGMLALDAGCAMGFFSLPLARLVGPSGRVVCVDIQKRMIAALKRRAASTGLADRIDAPPSRSTSGGAALKSRRRPIPIKTNNHRERWSNHRSRAFPLCILLDFTSPASILIALPLPWSPP